MDTLMVLILLAVVVVIAALVIASIHAQRRKQQETASRLASLGFRPVEADPALSERLAALHRVNEKQRFKIEDVYHWHAFDHELYFYDLTELSSTESSGSQRNLAVFSSHLRLPHFILVPGIPGEGLMARMSNLLLERIKPKGMARIELPDPLFEKQYQVYGEYAEQVKAFFTPRRMSWFGGRRYDMVMARGDGFLFSRFNLAQYQGKPVDENEWVREALAVLKILESEG